MKIKDWKLFEGYYQDSIKKLDSLKKEMVDIKSNYLAEVKNCLWDLIDDFAAEFVPVDGVREGDFLCVDFEIVVKPDKFEDLLDTLVGCNSKCESHIGKSINFEWVGIVTGTGTQTSKGFLRLNKNVQQIAIGSESIPFRDKIEYIRKSINIDEFSEAFGLKGINIIITV